MELQDLLDVVKKDPQGGQVSVVWHPERKWTVAVLWGLEGEDEAGQLASNASYGVGETLQEAVAMARKDIIA
jgi:hypothetical protein